MMRTPLAEIAERAGVSLATVSRVLNNQPNVAHETRQRVLGALRELMPAPTEALTIGLIVPDTQNPFFTELAFQFDKACDELKEPRASLMVASSDGRADHELRLLERFRDLGADGILFVSAGRQTETLATALDDSGMPPIVDVDRGGGNVDRVTVDSRKGTEQAVDHLVVFGHERIGYLKGLASTETAIERFESFKAAMAKNRLDLHENWIFEGNYAFDSGRRCAEEIMAMGASDRPSALLAANDLMAIGVMQRLQEAAWNLPAELSIVGFDDIPACEWVHPRLSTIAQPLERLTRGAVRLLLQRIQQRHDGAEALEPRVICIEPELKPRFSVVNPSQRGRLQVIPGG